MKTVFLVTTGDGEDGSEWQVHGIFSTREKAEAYQAVRQRTRVRPDGSEYFHAADVEEWYVDPKDLPE